MPQLGVPVAGDIDHIADHDQIALRLNEFHNVKDFGAVGDGSTDDSSAIASALSTAATAGGWVTFPPGTYVSSLQSVNSSLGLLAPNGATLKLKASSDSKLFTTSADLVVYGLTFDGNKASNTLAAGQGIVESTGDHLETLGVHIQNSAGDALRCTGLSGGRIRVRVTDALGHGVALVDSSDVDVDVDINGCDKSGVVVVPSSVDCERISVSGTIRSPARAGTPHIGVYFNSSPDGGSYAVVDSSIRATVVDAGYVGIFPGGDRNKVLGSTVLNSGVVTPDGAHGIWVHDSQGVVVSACVVKGAARSGVAVAKAHGCIITGSRAEFCGNAGFLHVYDATATPRYQGSGTNKGNEFIANHAISNSQASTDTWPGFYIDGGHQCSYIANHAHDYQATQTQARGLIANTNANTSGLLIVGNDFTGNISAAATLIPSEGYLSNVIGNLPNNNDIWVLATGNRLFFGSSTVRKVATGSPEGVITAEVGSLVLRGDGGAGTTLYVKESGSGNTGWVAK